MLKLPLPLPLLTLAALLTVGCASRGVSDEIVESWAQKIEERGKLPTGRVVSVERLAFVAERGATSPAAAMGVLGPVLGGLSIAVADRIRDTGFFFRHIIKMSDGTLRAVDLDHTYTVGECIAFRSGLQKEDQFPIRALRDECVGA